MDDLNLTKEKQANKISQYIHQLKQQLAQEQQWRKEDQEKLFNEKQQRILIDQRLTEREITLSRKNEEIEHLEYKVDSSQKKFQDLEFSIKDKGNKGYGFFGKMFSGREIDLIKLQMTELEEELEIKTDEIERLHMQIFDMKKEVIQKEELFDKKLYDSQNEIQVIMLQCTELNLRGKNLQQKLLESENNLLDRQNKIDEFIKILQQQEDQLRNFKEKLGSQNSALSEMQGNLQKNQDEFKRMNLENQHMQEISSFVRECIKTFITRLELSEEKSNMIEVQDILKDLRLMYSNKYTADIDKETRKMLMRNENQISNDILQVQLRTSMRLEKQNGKLIQINTILNDTNGLNPQAYEVFEKSKEKILKLGKINETLEKKNKVLQDKVNVLETKKLYQGQVN